MHFKIKHIAALAPDLQTLEQWQDWATNPVFEQGEASVPKLDFIPMMQRRRLSKFARLCFYALHHLGAGQNLPMVFASRCGDLVKTDELIENVAMQDPLSPTKFGLSVHNAVAGQYSIFTDNKQPSTTITAGVDTFHMALFDAVARLEQSNDDELVLICTETVSPDKYAPFIDEQQIDHSIAILLSKTQGREVSLTLNTGSKAADNSKPPLPQALQFMAWYLSDQNQTTITSGARCWSWQNGQQHSV